MNKKCPTWDIFCEGLARCKVWRGADTIVTNNVREVRRGELSFPRLRILTPAEFLKNRQNL